MSKVKLTTTRLSGQLGHAGAYERVIVGSATISGGIYTSDLNTP